MITAFVLIVLVSAFVGFRLGMRYERGLLIAALNKFTKYMVNEIDQAGTYAEAEQIVRDFAKKRGLR